MRRNTHVQEELEANLMNAGADDTIHPPLDPSRFIARVKAALRRARASPATKQGAR